MIAGRVTSLLLVLAVQFLLARLLSPADFGAYSVLASLVAVAALAAQLGLNYTVVRLTAEAMARKTPGQAHAAITGSLRLVAVAGMGAAMAVVWPVGPWLVHKILHDAPSTLLLSAVGGWLVLLAMHGMIAEAFRGLQNMPAAAVSAGLLSTGLMAVVLTALWVAGRTVSLQGALVATLVALGVALALNGGALLRSLAQIGARVRPDYRRLLLASWPAAITAVTLLTTRHVDLWVLGARGSPAEAALYGAATRLGDLASFPLMMVNAAIAPLIVELHAKGERHNLERIVRGAGFMATVPALLLAVPLMVGARPVMGLAYGAFYEDGAVVLILFLLANLINAATGPCTLVLLMTGHQRLVMWLTSSAACAIAAGSWAVAAPGGPRAVAMVACSVIALQNIATMLAAYRKLGIVTAMDWRGAHQLLPRW